MKVPANKTAPKPQFTKPIQPVVVVENKENFDPNQSPKEEKKEEIMELEETLEKVKKTHKPKPAYDLNDKEIKVISVEKDVKLRLIANNRGIFVDIRKYYKDYPTQKGIRLHAITFKEAYEMLKPDIDKMFPVDLFNK